MHENPDVIITNLQPENNLQLKGIKAAWQTQVNSNPDDPLILENAAFSLQNADESLAAEYLKRLRRLEPTYPQVATRLAIVYTQAIARMTDPIAGDSYGAIAEVELEQSNDVAVVGYTGEALYLLGTLKGERKPYAAFGEKLLKRAQELDPGNPRWSQVFSRRPPDSVSMIAGILATTPRERDLWPHGLVPVFPAPASAIVASPDAQAKKLMHSHAPEPPLSALGYTKATVQAEALISPDAKSLEST